MEMTGRPYSLGEEIANSITHGAGLVGAIAGSAIMLFVVAQQHDRLWFFADAVYAMSLIIMYAASTFYHAIPNRRAKPIFRVMDHAAIYLLIAGTYTPFALLNLRGVWGWWLCAAIWVLAIIGRHLHGAHPASAVARHHGDLRCNGLDGSPCRQARRSTI